MLLCRYRRICQWSNYYMVANQTWNSYSLVQEQNSFPGITNKLLGKKVDKICVAYDGLERFFPKGKIIKTGNPIREDLLDVDTKTIDAKTHFKLNHGRYTLLVLGGSLGARRINQLIEEKLEFFKDQKYKLFGNVVSCIIRTTSIIIS